MADSSGLKIFVAAMPNPCYRRVAVALMTERRLYELTILVLARSAQLVSVSDTAGAYGYLTAAAEFFRYTASPDRIVPLSGELGILRLLHTLDPSLDIRLPEGDESWACAFILRLSLLDAVMELLDENPGVSVTLEAGFEPGPESGSGSGTGSVSCSGFVPEPGLDLGSESGSRPGSGSRLGLGPGIPVCRISCGSTVRIQGCI